MALTQAQARAIAEEHLDSEVRPGLEDEVIITDYVEESERYWAFHYNTRLWIEQRDMLHALAGNGPVLVPKDGGAASLAGSSGRWQDDVGED